MAGSAELFKNLILDDRASAIFGKYPTNNPCLYYNSSLATHVLSMMCVSNSPIKSGGIYFAKIQTGLLYGLIPLVFILSSCGSNPKNSSTASPVSAEELAKTITDKEITNYAKTVVAIEQLRQTTNQEMIKISEGKPFNNVTCTEPETMTSLPTKMQEVAIGFCTKVKLISEENGLIIPRFNAITFNARNNPELQKKINEQLITLQK